MAIQTVLKTTVKRSSTIQLYTNSWTVRVLNRKTAQVTEKLQLSRVKFMLWYWGNWVNEIKIGVVEIQAQFISVWPGYGTVIKT